LHWELQRLLLLQFYCSTEFAIQTQETDQIYDFVREVGEEVEVQWGVSLDETLGEEVRVTLVATGYEVSDIPSLKEEVGQPTVEQAIKANYDELPQPMKPQQPKEDEPKQEIELEITQPAQPAQPVQPAQPASFSADDIQITLEYPDEESAKPAQPKQPEPKHHGFTSWMRTRR